jgi:hypothetical protein
LKAAVRMGHVETVRLFVEKGADLKAAGLRNLLVGSCILACQSRGKSDAGTELVQIFLENGAHAEDTTAGRTTAGSSIFNSEL